MEIGCIDRISVINARKKSMSSDTLPFRTPLADDPQRRTWLIATSAAGGVAAVATAVPFVSSFAPSERARAQGAAVEVEIGDIPPGGMKTVEWRGKPVWIVRRSPEMVAALATASPDLVDPNSQRDQQPPYAANATRSLRPEVFVAVGICTHLGCSPTAVPVGTANPSLPSDWQGGYFCPCHGSTFDSAGRVFKNKPAPTNLEIPPHQFLSDTRLLIGEDSRSA
jgi:ubiquinol-cytochrome c reductase iron-sulfur subunit